MNHRSAIAIAAATIGVFAAATSCSSSAKATAPSAAAVSEYLKDMRAVAAVQQPDAQRFSPKQTSDSQLLAVGEEACAELQDHKPVEVAGLLEGKGWSEGQAGMILMGAAAQGTLCPGQAKAVGDWVISLIPK